MNKINFISILFISSILWSSNLPFENEVLHYSVGFRSFSAGSATLSLKSDTLNNNNTYLLISTLKTNSFLSKFYKVRDVIKSWLSPSDLSLIKINKKIREGRYKKNHEALIVNDSMAISNNKKIKLPGKVYDPMSFIYFLRKQNLKIGNKYSFFSYGSKKIKEIIIKITGKEIIKVPYGTYDCYVIEPFLNNGKPLLKNNGAMKIWLSEDSLHIPIKIRQHTNIGNMILQLKSIKYSK